MSFKPIPVEKKIEAVSRAIAGEKIQQEALFFAGRAKEAIFSRNAP